MKHYIPSTLDIEKLLEINSPVKIERFDKDSLIIIIDTLLTIPATNKNLKIINGFVPISSKMLYRKVPNYKQYLTYLIESGILLCDRQFTIGKKCKGYKFTPIYHGTGIKSVELKRKRRHCEVDTKDRISSVERKQFSHVLSFYNSDLQIDAITAKEYLTDNLALKLNDKSLLDIDPRFGLAKDPFIQYRCGLIGIERIESGNFMLSIDKTSNRLHSVLTNLSSPLRNLITYRGRRLVSIDIRNCQPYLSSRVLIPDFWKKEPDHFAKLDVKRFLKKDGPQKFLYGKDYLEFEGLFRSISGSLENDLDTYIGNAMYGTFYEYMEKAVLEMTGKEFQDRKAVKQMIFQVLFTDNRFIGQKEAEPKKLFRQLFPTVYKLFSLIKKHDKRILPILLQRMESYIILQIVCKRISKERPDLPFFTIHDSIVTVQGEEDYVREVMRDEFIDQIAFPPSFNIDYWSPENLTLKDGNVFEMRRLTA